MDKLNRKQNPFIKFVSSLLLVTFCLTSVSNQSLYAQTPSGSVRPHHGISPADPMSIMGSVMLPEELGIIGEKYAPEDVKDKLIIYLQSAHANYDSEANTKEIIQFFQKNYGLDLVLLEGGEGSLDSLFFKSYPDESAKEKILNDYLSKGDLTGGEIASILSQSSDTKFFGIETQALYNENKDVFLKAVANEAQIEEILDKIKNELLSQSGQLSKEVRSFWDEHAKFEKEDMNLLEYVKVLLSLRAKRSNLETGIASVALLPRNDAEVYPELSKLVTAQSSEKHFQGQDFDAAMTLMIKSFKEKALPKLPKTKQIEINQMIQMHQIGHLSQGMLLKRIEDLSREINFSFEAPKILKPAAEHAKTLSSIKGTKIFYDLENLEAELRQALPHSNQERALISKLYHVELLEKFARLELLHKDWQELKDKKPSELLGQETRDMGQALVSRPVSLDSLFAPHFEFYTLALRRDKALFENMLNRMNTEKAKVVLVSTGGFHSEGMTKQLKDQKIPYLLISPNIHQTADRSVYLNAMQDKHSYMKYFSGSLWDALAKDYASKLALAVPEEPFTNLKRWRDQIIQDSIAEGKVTQAGRYTKYVDALAKVMNGGESVEGSQDEAQIRQALQKELDSYFSNYFNQVETVLKQRLDVVSTGLKQIWKTKDLSPQSIGSLVERAMSAQAAGISQKIALIPMWETVRPQPASLDLPKKEGLPKFEVRAETREFVPQIQSHQRTEVRSTASRNNFYFRHPALSISLAAVGFYAAAVSILTYLAHSELKQSLVVALVFTAGFIMSLAGFIKSNIETIDFEISTDELAKHKTFGGIIHAHLEPREGEVQRSQILQVLFTPKSGEPRLLFSRHFSGHILDYSDHLKQSARPGTIRIVHEKSFSPRAESRKQRILKIAGAALVGLVVTALTWRMFPVEDEDQIDQDQNQLSILPQISPVVSAPGNSAGFISREQLIDLTFVKIRDLDQNLNSDTPNILEAQIELAETLKQFLTLMEINTTIKKFKARLGQKQFSETRTMVADIISLAKTEDRKLDEGLVNALESVMDPSTLRGSTPSSIIDLLEQHGVNQEVLDQKIKKWKSEQVASAQPRPEVRRRQSSRHGKNSLFPHSVFLVWFGSFISLSKINNSLVLGLIGSLLVTGIYYVSAVVTMLALDAKRSGRRPTTVYTAIRQLSVDTFKLSLDMLKRRMTDLRRELQDVISADAVSPQKLRFYRSRLLRIGIDINNLKMDAVELRLYSAYEFEQLSSNHRYLESLYDQILHLDQPDNPIFGADQEGDLTLAGMDEEHQLWNPEFTPAAEPPDDEEQFRELESKLQQILGRDFMIRFSGHTFDGPYDPRNSMNRFLESKSIPSFFRIQKIRFGDVTIPQKMTVALGVVPDYKLTGTRASQFHALTFSAERVPLTGILFFYEDSDRPYHEIEDAMGEVYQIPTRFPIWSLDNGTLAVNLAIDHLTPDALEQAFKAALNPAPRRAEVRAKAPKKVVEINEALFGWLSPNLAKAVGVYRDLIEYEKIREEDEQSNFVQRQVLEAFQIVKNGSIDQTEMLQKQVREKIGAVIETLRNELDAADPAKRHNLEKKIATLGTFVDQTPDLVDFLFEVYRRHKNGSKTAAERLADNLSEMEITYRLHEPEPASPTADHKGFNIYGPPPADYKPYEVPQLALKMERYIDWISYYTNVVRYSGWFKLGVIIASISAFYFARQSILKSALGNPDQAQPMLYAFVNLMLFVGIVLGVAFYLIIRFNYRSSHFVGSHAIRPPPAPHYKEGLRQKYASDMTQADVPPATPRDTTEEELPRAETRTLIGPRDSIEIEFTKLDGQALTIFIGQDFHRIERTFRVYMDEEGKIVVEKLAPRTLWEGRHQDIWIFQAVLYLTNSLVRMGDEVGKPFFEIHRKGASVLIERSVPEDQIPPIQVTLFPRAETRPSKHDAALKAMLGKVRRDLRGIEGTIRDIRTEQYEFYPSLQITKQELKAFEREVTDAEIEASVKMDTTGSRKMKSEIQDDSMRLDEFVRRFFIGQEDDDEIVAGHSIQLEDDLFDLNSHWHLLAKYAIKHSDLLDQTRRDIKRTIANVQELRREIGQKTDHSKNVRLSAMIDLYQFIRLLRKIDKYLSYFSKKSYFKRMGFEVLETDANSNPKTIRFVLTQKIQDTSLLFIPVGNVMVQVSQISRKYVGKTIVLHIGTAKKKHDLRVIRVYQDKVSPENFLFSYVENGDQFVSSNKPLKVDEKYKVHHPLFPKTPFYINTSRGFKRAKNQNQFRVLVNADDTIRKIVDGSGYEQDFYEVYDKFDGKVIAYIILRSKTLAWRWNGFRGVVSGIPLLLEKRAQGRSDVAYIEMFNRSNGQDKRFYLAAGNYAQQKVAVRIDGALPVESKIIPVETKPKPEAKAKRKVNPPFYLILKRNHRGRLVDVAKEAFMDRIGNFTGTITRFKADAYGRASLGAPLTGEQVADPSKKGTWVSAALVNGVIIRTDEWGKLAPEDPYKFTKNKKGIYTVKVKSGLKPKAKHEFIVLQNFKQQPVNSYKFRISVPVYFRHEGIITGLKVRRHNEDGRVTLPGHSYTLPGQYKGRAVTILQFPKEAWILFLIHSRDRKKVVDAYLYELGAQQPDVSLGGQLKIIRELRKRYEHPFHLDRIWAEKQGAFEFFEKGREAYLIGDFKKAQRYFRKVPRTSREFYPHAQTYLNKSIPHRMHLLETGTNRQKRRIMRESEKARKLFLENAQSLTKLMSAGWSNLESNDRVETRATSVTVTSEPIVPFFWGGDPRRDALYKRPDLMEMVMEFLSNIQGGNWSQDMQAMLLYLLSDMPIDTALWKKGKTKEISYQALGKSEKFVPTKEMKDVFVPFWRAIANGEIDLNALTYEYFQLALKFKYTPIGQVSTEALPDTAADVQHFDLRVPQFRQMRFAWLTPDLMEQTRLLLLQSRERTIIFPDDRAEVRNKAKVQPSVDSLLDTAQKELDGVRSAKIDLSDRNPKSRLEILSLDQELLVRAYETLNEAARIGTATGPMSEDQMARWHEISEEADQISAHITDLKDEAHSEMNDKTDVYAKQLKEAHYRDILKQNLKWEYFGHRDFKFAVFHFGFSLAVGVYAKSFSFALLLAGAWLLSTALLLDRNYRRDDDPLGSVNIDALKDKPWLSTLESKLNWIEQISKHQDGLSLNKLIDFYVGLRKAIWDEASSEDLLIAQAYINTLDRMAQDSSILPFVSRDVLKSKIARPDRMWFRMSLGFTGMIEVRKPEYEVDIRVSHKQVMSFISLIRTTIPGLSFSTDRAEVRNQKINRTKFWLGKNGQNNVLVYVELSGDNLQVVAVPYQVQDATPGKPIVFPQEPVEFNKVYTVGNGRSNHFSIDHPSVQSLHGVFRLTLDPRGTPWITIDNISKNQDNLPVQNLEIPAREAAELALPLGPGPYEVVAGKNVGKYKFRMLSKNSKILDRYPDEAVQKIVGSIQKDLSKQFPENVKTEYRNANWLVSWPVDPGATDEISISVPKFIDEKPSEADKALNAIAETNPLKDRGYYSGTVAKQSGYYKLTFYHRPKRAEVRSQIQSTPAFKNSQSNELLDSALQRLIALSPDLTRALRRQTEEGDGAVDQNEVVKFRAEFDRINRLSTQISQSKLQQQLQNLLQIVDGRIRRLENASRGETRDRHTDDELDRAMTFLNQAKSEVLQWHELGNPSAAPPTTRTTLTDRIDQIQSELVGLKGILPLLLKTSLPAVIEKVENLKTRWPLSKARKGSSLDATKRNIDQAASILSSLITNRAASGPTGRQARGETRSDYSRIDSLMGEVGGADRLVRELKSLMEDGKLKLNGVAELDELVLDQELEHRVGTGYRTLDFEPIMEAILRPEIFGLYQILDYMGELKIYSIQRSQLEVAIHDAKDPGKYNAAAELLEEVRGALSNAYQTRSLRSDDEVYIFRRSILNKLENAINWFHDHVPSPSSASSAPALDKALDIIEQVEEIFSVFHTRDLLNGGGIEMMDRFLGELRSVQDELKDLEHKKEISAKQIGDLNVRKFLGTFKRLHLSNKKGGIQLSRQGRVVLVQLLRMDLSALLHQYGRAEVRQAEIPKQLQEFQLAGGLDELITALIRDWAQIKAQGLFVFDMQKTLVARKAVATEKMIELLAWLLGEGIRIEIDSGNTDQEVLHQVIHPLLHFLSASGRPSLIQDVIVDANSGTLLMGFDFEGKPIYFPDYQRNLVISGKVTQELSVILQELAQEGFLVDEYLEKTAERSGQFGELDVQRMDAEKEIILKEWEDMYQKEEAKEKGISDVTFDLSALRGSNHFEATVVHFPYLSKGLRLSAPHIQVRGLVSVRGREKLPTKVAITKFHPKLRGIVIARIEEELQQRLPPEVYQDLNITSGGESTIDITSKRANKALGIVAIVDRESVLILRQIWRAVLNRSWDIVRKRFLRLTVSTINPAFIYVHGDELTGDVEGALTSTSHEGNDLVMLKPKSFPDSAYRKMKGVAVTPKPPVGLAEAASRTYYVTGQRPAQTEKLVEQDATEFYLERLRQAVEASRLRAEVRTVKSPLEALRDPKIKKLILDIISFYGAKHTPTLGRELSERILDSLERYADNPELATKITYENVVDPRNLESPIALAYHNSKYRAGLKLDLILKMIGNYIGEGVVANIGAGDNLLSERISQTNPHISRIIGMDIRSRALPSDDSKVEYIQQTEPDHLPLIDNSVDSAILIYVLHHAGPSLEQLVREAFRIIKPGGKLIVLEDSWSNKLTPSVPSKLLDNFLALSLEQQYQVYAFNDWYSHQFVAGYSDMPMYMGFKTLEDWEQLFVQNGFSVKHVEFVGFPDLPFSQKVPQGVLILEKPEKALPLSATPTNKIEEAERMFRQAQDFRKAGRLNEAEQVEEDGFLLIQSVVQESLKNHISLSKPSKLLSSEIVVHAPARIDFNSGLGSDRFVVSMQEGGKVLNAAIVLNGQKPISISIKPIKEPEIRIISQNLSQTITHAEDLLVLSKSDDSLKLYKAALYEAGLVPELFEGSLEKMFKEIGGGLEIVNQSQKITAGSGLGVSSILAAAVIKGLFEITGRKISDQELILHVINLEQRIGSFGGWQDSVGGVFGGIKWIQAEPGSPVPTFEELHLTSETLNELKSRLILIDTGKGHSSNDLARQTVIGYLLKQEPGYSAMKKSWKIRSGMYQALLEGDIDTFGSLLTPYMEQLIAQRGPQVSSTLIDRIIKGIKDLGDIKISGSGGGGFIFVVSKYKDTKLLRKRLNEILETTDAKIVNFDFDFEGIKVINRRAEVRAKAKETETPKSTYQIPDRVWEFFGRLKSEKTNHRQQFGKEIDLLNIKFKTVAGLNSDYEDISRRLDQFVREQANIEDFTPDNADAVKVLQQFLDGLILPDGASTFLTQHFMLQEFFNAVESSPVVQESKSLPKDDYKPGFDISALREGGHLDKAFSTERLLLNVAARPKFSNGFTVQSVSQMKKDPLLDEKIIRNPNSVVMVLLQRGQVMGQGKDGKFTIYRVTQKGVDDAEVLAKEIVRRKKLPLKSRKDSILDFMLQLVDKVKAKEFTQADANQVLVNPDTDKPYGPILWHWLREAVKEGYLKSNGKKFRGKGYAIFYELTEKGETLRAEVREVGLQQAELLMARQKVLTNVQYSRAEENDLPEIVRLYETEFIPRVNGRTSPVHMFQHYLNKVYRWRDQNFIMTARVNGEMAGFILAERTGSKVIMYFIAVVPKFENSGIASELTHRAIVWAESLRGVKFVVARDGSQDGTSARILERQGFKLISTPDAKLKEFELDLRTRAETRTPAHEAEEAIAVAKQQVRQEVRQEPFPYTEAAFTEPSPGNWGVSLRERFVDASGNPSKFYGISLLYLPSSQEKVGLVAIQDQIVRDLPFVASQFYRTKPSSIHVTLKPLSGRKESFSGAEIATLKRGIHYWLKAQKTVVVPIKGLFIGENTGRIRAVVEFSDEKKYINLFTPYLPLAPPQIEELRTWIAQHQETLLGQFKIDHARLIYNSDSFSNKRLINILYNFPDRVEARSSKSLIRANSKLSRFIQKMNVNHQVVVFVEPKPRGQQIAQKEARAVLRQLGFKYVVYIEGGAGAFGRDFSRLSRDKKAGLILVHGAFPHAATLVSVMGGNNTATKRASSTERGEYLPFGGLEVINITSLDRSDLTAELVELLMNWSNKTISDKKFKVSRVDLTPVRLKKNPEASKTKRAETRNVAVDRILDLLEQTNLLLKPYRDRILETHRSVSPQETRAIMEYLTPEIKDPLESYLRSGAIQLNNIQDPDLLTFIRSILGIHLYKFPKEFVVDVSTSEALAELFNLKYEDILVRHGRVAVEPDANLVSEQFTNQFQLLFKDNRIQPIVELLDADLPDEPQVESSRIGERNRARAIAVLDYFDTVTLSGDVDSRALINTAYGPVFSKIKKILGPALTYKHEASIPEHMRYLHRSEVRNIESLHQEILEKINNQRLKKNLSIEKLDRILKSDEVDQEINRLAQANNLKREQIQLLKKLIHVFRLIPGTPYFDAVAWILESYIGKSNQLQEHFERGMTGHELQRWIEEVIYPVNPNFQFPIPNPDERLTREVMVDFPTELERQLYLPLGVTLNTSPFRPGQFSISKIIGRSIETSPAGRQVPVYVARPIDRDVFGGGGAKTDWVVYSILATSDVEDELEEIQEGQRRGLVASVELLSPAQLISYKIYKHLLTRGDIAKAIREIKEAMVIEELSHSDLFDFGRRLTGVTVTQQKKEQYIKMVSAIVKPNSEYSDYFQSSRGVGQNFMRAKTVLEMEGHLNGLRLAKYPLRYFLSFFIDSIFNPTQRNIPDVYTAMYHNLIKEIGSILLGVKTLDLNRWIQYLNQVQDWDVFNERVRQAADIVYKKNFINLDEREELVRTGKVVNRTEVRNEFYSLDTPIEKIFSVRTQNVLARIGITTLAGLLRYPKNGLSRHELLYPGSAARNEIDNFLKRSARTLESQIKKALENQDIDHARWLYRNYALDYLDSKQRQHWKAEIYRAQNPDSRAEDFDSRAEARFTQSDALSASRRAEVRALSAFELESLKRLLLDRYGVQNVTNITPLQGGVMSTLQGQTPLLVETARGKFVWRQVAENQEKARLIISFINHLHRKGLPVPKMYARIDTGSMKSDSDHYLNSIGSGYFSLEEFLEQGSFVKREEATSIHYRSLGNLAARIQNASADFISDGHFIWKERSKLAREYDVRQFDRLQQELTQKKDAGADLNEGEHFFLENFDRIKDLLNVNLNRFREIYTDSLRAKFADTHEPGALTNSFIHNDLIFGNVKFDKNGNIVALIDFGFAQEDHRISEFNNLTVGLSETAPFVFDWDLIGEAVSAYQTQIDRKLTPEELTGIKEILRYRLLEIVRTAFFSPSSLHNVIKHPRFIPSLSKILDVLSAYDQLPALRAETRNIEYGTVPHKKLKAFSLDLRAQTVTSARAEVRKPWNELDPQKVKNEYLPLLSDVDFEVVKQLLDREGYDFTVNPFRGNATLSEAVQSSNDYFVAIPTLLYGAAKVKLESMGALPERFKRPTVIDYQGITNFPTAFDRMVMQPVKNHELARQISEKIRNRAPQITGSDILEIVQGKTVPNSSVVREIFDEYGISLDPSVILNSRKPRARNIIALVAEKIGSEPRAEARNIAAPTVEELARELINLDSRRLTQKLEVFARSHSTDSIEEQARLLKELNVQVLAQLKQIQSQATINMTNQIVNELLMSAERVTAKEVKDVTERVLAADQSLTNMKPLASAPEFQKIATLINDYVSQLKQVNGEIHLTDEGIEQASGRLTQLTQLDRERVILSDVQSPAALKTAADFASATDLVFVFQFNSAQALTAARAALRMTNKSHFLVASESGNRLLVLNRSLASNLGQLHDDSPDVYITSKIEGKRQGMILASQYVNRKEVDTEDLHYLITAAALLLMKPGITQGTIFRFTDRNELRRLTSALSYVLANRAKELELQAIAA